MDPFTGSLILGGLSTGLGILQGNAAQNAQQAQAQAEWDYRNAVAKEQYLAQKAAYKDAKRFQRASQEYAEWSAQFQAKYEDLGNQYAYWQQTLNWNQQRSYIQSLRNIELIKAIKQAQVVRDTRAGAARDYMLQSEALGDALQEEATRDSIAIHQYHAQAAKIGAEAIAVGQSGSSIDRMVGDYARQAGDLRVITQINQGFRQRQFNREQAGQIAGYLSQYNSQEFYEKQPYLDPIKPFPPLPTLIIPPPPSSTGPGPSAPAMIRPGNTSSSGASFLNAANSIMGGIQTGLGAWQNLSKFTSPTAGLGAGAGSFASSTPWSFPSSGFFSGGSSAVTAFG
jgi:hypothetical protein